MSVNPRGGPPKSRAGKGPILCHIVIFESEGPKIEGVLWGRARDPAGLKGGRASPVGGWFFGPSARVLAVWAGAPAQKGGGALEAWGGSKSVETSFVSQPLPPLDYARFLGVGNR